MHLDATGLLLGSKAAVHFFSPVLQEIVERCCGNVTIVLERVKCAAAERIVFNERIGADTSSLHGLPQRGVRYHMEPPQCGFHYSLRKEG